MRTHQTWQKALGEICFEMANENEHEAISKDGLSFNSYHFPEHDKGNLWGVSVFDSKQQGADGEDLCILIHEQIVAPSGEADFEFAANFFHFISKQLSKPRLVEIHPDDAFYGRLEEHGINLGMAIELVSGIHEAKQPGYLSGTFRLDDRLEYFFYAIKISPMPNLSELPNA